MKIPKDQIRNILKSSDWRLYISQFPRCVSEENRWSSETGVRISYTITSPASDTSEGEILITFLDTLSEKVRSFLHDWREGVSETGTGRQQPLEDLKAIVKLHDENNVEEDINIILKFLRESDMGSENPNLKAVYYY